MKISSTVSVDYIFSWKSKFVFWRLVNVAGRLLCVAFSVETTRPRHMSNLSVLSDKFLENDLVAVKQPDLDGITRLCVVRPDGTVEPLCLHEDDVETDLFVDPRNPNALFRELTDIDIASSYGEGFYGQRPVPSLGGGPGYGAPADEIWSVSEDVLEKIREDGVDLPILDVGISHGEKARGGAF